MSDVKIHTNEELKKMSKEDLKDLLNVTLKQLAHQKLHVRANENKQSHMIDVLKKQVARIQTLKNIKNEK